MAPGPSYPCITTGSIQTQLSPQEARRVDLQNLFFLTFIEYFPPAAGLVKLCTKPRISQLTAAHPQSVCAFNLDYNGRVSQCNLNNVHLGVLYD